MKLLFSSVLILGFLANSISWAEDLGRSRDSNWIAEATRTAELKSWSDFDHFMQDSKNRHENEGLSYMISGSLAVIGGTIGYQSETDALGKLMLSVTQSLGVAAVAYGAEQYYLGSEYQSFYLAVKESHLSDLERSEVLTRFLDHEKEKKNQARWIHVVSHGLIAALNLYQASQESNQSLRTGLGAIGIVNLGLAIHYSF